MKLKFTFIAILAMLFGFTFTANAQQVEVSTLEALQNALKGEGSSVVITETIVIPQGETVVLDLNGKTVTRLDETNKYAINNLGTLTIKDTKGNGSINARGIYNGYGDGGANVSTAKITVLSGTINAKGTNGGAAIFNYGTANVNGGNFTSIGGYSLNNQAGASMIIADGVTANNGIYASNATLVVNGGEINGNRSGCHVLYAWNSVVTINGGTFHNNNSGNSTTMAGGTTKLTINGGTFSIANGKSTNGWTSCLIDATDGGKYEINGGEFNGHFRVQANCAMEINGGTFENTHGEAYVNGGTVAVKGGTFTDAAAQKFATDNLAAGYELGEDGKVTSSIAYVAKIGEQGYATLEAAFAAATEGQTITLLGDATPALTSQRAITKAAVIDLGGKTMTLTEDDLYFGTTTFKNGTIVVDPSVKPSTAVFWMFANQTLTFDNVKIVATGVTGTYLIGLDGNNSDLNLLNGSEILVENTTALDLDIICVNASTGNDIKVENSKVNVTNLDGRVFFRGNYTVNNSEINLAGITKAGFRIEAGQTLSIEGTSNVNIEGEPRDGGIHLTDLSATYTKAETATVNATVNAPAPAYVAKIGEQGYETLAAALEATKTMTGDVTVEIYEKVTLNGPFTGSYSSINFVGKDTDAEIYLDIQGYIEAAGKKVAFENLLLSKSQGGYVANAGFMNLAFGVFGVTEATYTNCTFANGAYASTGKVTYTGCTFKPSWDRYAFWAYGDADITIDGCTFAAARGIKMYDEGKERLAAVTIKNSNFSAVTDKPAIVLTSGESVTLEDNTYSSTGVFELDLDGVPNGTPVTSDVTPVCVNDNGACGVLVDGKIYTTVAQAAEVATETSTVVLLHNSTETVEFPMGTTIDKNGFTADNVTTAKPVAKIGDVEYATLAEAVNAAQAGETIELIADAEVVADETVTLDGVNLSTLNGVTLTNNGTVEVKGEVSLNIATLTGEEINFLDGAIVKNSTIGGSVFVAGNVTFRGANTFAMLYDYGTLTDYYGTTAPMKWTVEEGASVTLTNAARYGLGYGDDVTVYGNIENALTARENLTDADRSLFMHGLVAQESKGWNCDSKFTVENAYVAIGSNNSFGNKSGNYGGTYTFNIKNSVVDASRITFYEALSTTTFTFDGCDVKMGTFMTRDADSEFTLKNSKVLSTTASNGTDEGNYNKGELTLENSTLTYSAEFKHEAGTINLDLNSSITAPKMSGVGTININAEGVAADVLVIKANMSGFTGAINVEGGKYEITDEGLVVKPMALEGEGTEANPYLISSVDDLVLFRNSVNAGETKYNAEGVYVALGANIDLAGVANWSPIGTWDYSFDANFDGKGKKIMNLKMSDNTAANGEAYLGFFGITANNEIKNLVIENVTIESAGQIVAAAIAYPYYTTVSDITVCGDIAIKGGNYTAGVLAYTRLCQNASNLAVVGNEGSCIEGAQVVGGVIADIQMNNGLVANYSNFSAEGVAVKGTKMVGGISGIIATQTLNGAAVKNVTLSSGDSRVGTIAGAFGGTSTISNVTVENVTGATAIVGPTYKGSNAVEARIGDTYYSTLQAAVDAVEEKGTVTLLADVDASEITTGKNFTIALNGNECDVTLPDGYAALPDLNGNYVIGAQPTATVNNLGMTTVAAGDYAIWDGSFDSNTEDDGDMPLSFVMQFLADQDAEDMATSPFADWYGDFVLTFTGLENGSFTADNCYLAGHYGSFGWVKIPVDGMVIEDGARYPVMLGVGMGQKYDYICSSVEDFKCALYLAPEILAANPNIEVKLELGVVDNSKGSDAAASALVNNENVYSVTEYTYDALDFDPSYIAEFVIDDANSVDYTFTEEKTVGTLTYKRTLAEGVWNPLYLPFQISVKELVENYDIAYYNQMISIDTNNDGAFDDYEMEVAYITTGTLRANYPYFIRPKSAEDCTLEYVAEDVTLYPAVEKVIVTSSVANIFTLSGTHKAMSAEDLAGCYAISLDGWAPSESGIKAHRLYLKIEENDNSPFATTAAKSIRIVVRGEGDGTTGVEEVETENGEVKAIYDLTGRRVQETVKGGIYIVNGKKVLVK